MGFWLHGINLNPLNEVAGIVVSDISGQYNAMNGMNISLCFCINFTIALWKINA
jgi:hypothetical protein